MVNIYKRLLSDVGVGMETRRRQKVLNLNGSQQIRDNTASSLFPRSWDI
jgi:hypothetical protein